jgi:hypothetical protein
MPSGKNPWLKGLGSKLGLREMRNASNPGEPFCQ